MLTYGQFRSSLKSQIFVDGESSNLVIPHDRSFIDALIDIQTWVPCAQQNNTSLFPHCATFYRCGLTVIDNAPRGQIRSLSVIDKLNPDTGLEDPDSPDEWCSEVFYAQVDPCHFKSYLAKSMALGCCLPIPLFFGLGACSKGLLPVPIPTDEGLPEGLPLLPLGFHYPQESTDRAWGRAGAGVWALDRGQILIAPWIQTTETVVIVWDGIKREWTDADPIDSDPLLAKAVRLYVQEQHAGEWDHEHDEEAIFGAKYGVALAALIHQCREETRVRSCGSGGADGSSGSNARGIAAGSLTSIFYNDDQSASASCPQGTTGSPVSVTIPAGTIGSAISKADANQKAMAQAQEQATAQLVCTTIPVTYTNAAQTATASCAGESDAPIPDGSPVTVTVSAGEIVSSISQTDADTRAYNLALLRATTQLHCTYWNRAKTVAVTCQSDSGITATETVAAHTYSSTVSQAEADAKATTAATNAANQSLTDQGCTDNLFWNTEQHATYSVLCQYQTSTSHGSLITTGCADLGHFPKCITITYNVTVPAHTTNGATQSEANQAALTLGQNAAQAGAQNQCRLKTCAQTGCTTGNKTFEVTYPVP